MNQTNKKSKSVIRYEAVLPLLIVVVTTAVYFKLFFDLHLKMAFEYLGYNIVGAEVNVAKVETSFLKGTFRVLGIEVTNSENPQTNSLEIADIRFGVLWDGLLKARLVVEEVAVEGIKTGSSRKSPGKVKPPPKVKEQGPSALGEAASDLKEKSLNTIENKYSDNVMGDLAAMLGGTSSNQRLNEISGSLTSKAKLDSLEKTFSQKQNEWQKKIKDLPTDQEIQQLGNKLSKIKTKDFKSPDELAQSLKELDAVLKEADSKLKLVQATGDDLSSTLNQFQKDYEELEILIKKDIQDIEARLKIPKLDAKNLTQAVFMQYASPYLAKVNRYKATADQYLPPNLLKKKGQDEAEIKPHPRAHGVVYEFGKPNAYPMFWLKRIKISSEANEAGQGKIQGLVTDITSNQKLIGKPTVIDIEGDFPSNKIYGLKTKISLDGRPEPSLIDFTFNVRDYFLASTQLIQSSDVDLALEQSNIQVQSSGSLVGLNVLNYKMEQNLRQAKYDVNAKNEVLAEVLKETFAKLPQININLALTGSLPLPSLNLTSNFGSELEKGLRLQVQRKIDEAKKSIEAMIRSKIGDQKSKLDQQYSAFKNQFESEVKKVQILIEAEKKSAENKANTSKKSAEADARKKLEDEARKALGNDGQKKLEDLKKKLGF